MKQPKFSEVLRAAARGYMEPYSPALDGLNNGYVSRTFNTSDYERAKCTAAAFNAIADLYDTYERAADSASLKPYTVTD